MYMQSVLSEDTDECHCIYRLGITTSRPERDTLVGDDVPVLLAGGVLLPGPFAGEALLLEPLDGELLFPLPLPKPRVGESSDLACPRPRPTNGTDGSSVRA